MSQKYLSYFKISNIWGVIYIRKICKSQDMVEIIWHNYVTVETCKNEDYLLKQGKENKMKY